MLSNTEFDLWCQRLNLTKEARVLINDIRNSAPARRVGSYKGNVSGRYPSRKMGVTIQFESHKNELALIHEMEHDHEVLEYFDQPTTIKLDYESTNGRHLGVLHTADFFVIREHMAGWEECKTEEQLVKLCSHNANRYFRDIDGIWRCLPGEAYGEKFSLYYRVRSSKDINWTYQRNIEFIDDYFRSDSITVKAETRDLVFAQVIEELGITLEELFKRTEGGATHDDIFMLIANDAVYVNLRVAPLVEQDQVRVFRDRDTSIAFENIVQTVAQSGRKIPRLINLAVGSIIQWDGKGWSIVNVGETMIGLIGEDRNFIELPIDTFEALIRAKRINGTTLNMSSNIHPEAKKRLEQAGKQDYAEANRRSEIVRAYMRGEPLPSKVHIPERTLRFWSAQYRAAQEIYGSGYIGLLPRVPSGNIKNKLPLPTRALINEFIQNEYETLKQKPKFEVYSAFLLACKRQGIMAASYKTFYKAVKLRPRYEQTLKRKGRRAAYRYKEFYYQLESTTPRHGERPFHIAHIDHTELDAELACSITGNNLGRAWATFLTDAYSRRLLAVYISYDPPSYRSCMMILRECVRRFNRLPQIVVVDGGLEFSAIYFETLLARYECTKKQRPPAESRFGSVGERLFGTTNTRFIHNLQGNTQIMRNVRQVTKSVNPHGQALWTLERLHYYLCQWAYEVYDTIEHPALGQTPRDAFAAGMISSGERLHRLIAYDEDFKMHTLPTTPKTTAKVQTGHGVKINYIYYWSDAFRHPQVEGARIEVRFDPWDAGIAYAFVRHRWVDCRSERYTIFHNRSERELMIATQELRKRYKRHSSQLNVTAIKLAKFLESTEAEESLLRQRSADRESRVVLAAVNGDLLPRNIELVNRATVDTQSDSQEAAITQPPTSLESYRHVSPEAYEEF